MSVVDASVWVSRVLPQDTNHSASREWLEGYLAAGQLAVGPALLLAEVAGAISRRTGSARLAHRVSDAMEALPGLRLVAIDSRMGAAASGLAADLGLRGADAVYVAVARLLELPLVTWDEEQRKRAGRVIRVEHPRAG